MSDNNDKPKRKEPEPENDLLNEKPDDESTSSTLTLKTLWDELSPKRASDKASEDDTVPGQHTDSASKFLDLLQATREAYLAAVRTNSQEVRVPFVPTAGSVELGTDVIPALSVSFHGEANDASDIASSKQVNKAPEGPANANALEVIAPKGDGNERPVAVVGKLDDPFAKTAFIQLLEELNPAINPGSRGYDFAKVKAELEKGEFGVESRKAYNQAAGFLENKTGAMLRLLDARGIEIPLGCPIEPQVDPRSGRRIMPDWFEAQLRAGQNPLKLQVGETTVPNPADILLMRKSATWNTRADVQMEHAIVESRTEFLKSQVETINFEGRLNGWKPRPDMTDAEKEQWSYAVSPWLSKINQVRNYSHSIAALHVATKDGSAPDKIFGLNVPKLTTLPRSIFSEAALKDENFPGHVQLDDKGHIVSMEFDLPKTLERTPENEAKIRKLDQWMQKWAPGVDQVLQTLSAAAIEQGRVLMWGDVSVEGTIKPNGFEVIAAEKKSDGRGGTVDTPLRRKFFATEVEANQHLEELKKDPLFKDNPNMVFKVEQKDEIKIEDHPLGSLFDNRQLAPGEQKFNLREFRFSAEQVKTPDGPMIAVTSSHKYQYAPMWSLYNVYARDVKSDVSGSQEKPVYYKPDDFVPVIDNGRMQLIQAKNLPRMATEGAFSHYGGKAANIGMDIGFCLMGGFEIRAAWQLAGKQALAAGAKATFATCLKETVLSRGAWHSMLGMTGIFAHPIEEAFGHAGKEFNKYRNYAMLGDIALHQTFVGTWAKSIWGASSAAGKVEQASAFKKLCDASTFYKGVTQGLKAPELFMLTEILGRTVPDMIARGRPDNLGQAVEQTKAYRGPAYMPDSDTLTRLGAAQREVDSVRNLPDTDGTKAAKVEALATKYAEKYASAGSDEEKFIAALGLLAIKGKKGEQLPAELAHYKKDGKDQVIAKANVEKFLQDFQALQSKKQIEEYGNKTDIQDPEINFQKISDMLALPETDAKRQEYTGKLLAAVQEVRRLERRVDELAAGLKRNRDLFDQNSHSSDDRRIYERIIERLEAQHKLAQEELQKKDVSKAVVAAMGLSVLGVNKENGLLNRELAKGDVFTFSATVRVPDGKGGFISKQVEHRTFSSESEANAAKDEFNKAMQGETPKPYASVKKEQLTFTAADLVKTLDRSIGALPPGALQAASSDMLMRMGERDIWQHTSVLQSTLSDTKASRLAKADAMLGNNSVGLGEFFEMMRFDMERRIQSLDNVEERSHALSHTYGRDSIAIQDSLLKIVRDKNEGPDVRALASRILLANSAPTELERKAQLQACRDDWNKLKDEPGQFCAQFTKSAKADLQADANQGDELARQATAEKKFRAALALSELGGPEAIGIDAETRKKITAALVECFDYTKPGLALQVLRHLIPGRLNELTPEQLKLVRTTAVEMLGPGTEGLLLEDQRKLVSEVQERVKQAEVSKDENKLKEEKETLAKETALLKTLEANQESRGPLRRDLVQRITPLMTQGADADEYKQVLSALRDTVLRKELQSSFHAAGDANLREVAARAYADIAGRRKLQLESEIDKAPAEKKEQLEKNLQQLELEGTDFFRRVLGVGADAKERDGNPQVRMAAVDGLRALDAPDLQSIVMNLLKTESDPTISKKLYGMEYVSRRMDENSAEYAESYEKVKLDLQRRAKEVSLTEGKAICDELRARGRQGGRLWWETLIDMAKGDGDEAKRARGGLMYLFHENDGVGGGLWLRNALLDILKTKGPAVREELAGSIMFALMSGSQMPTYTKYGLVELLSELRPGTAGSPVKRIEASVTLLTVLQSQIGKTGESDLRFQSSVLRELSKYPSEKILPALEAMIGSEIVQKRDAWERPLRARYTDGTGFDYVYEKDGLTGYLKEFTEHPSGEKWTPDPERKGYWKSDKGNSRLVGYALAHHEGDMIIAAMTPKGFYQERYATSGKFEKEEDRKVTVVRPGKPDTTIHPDRYIVADARKLVDNIRNGAGFIQMKAVEDLNEIEAQTKANKDFKPEFGPKVPLPELAAKMAAKVGNINHDAISTCRTIFAAGLQPPIKDANDPRREVLMIALKDAHEMVRLSAARVLFLNSDLKTDRELGASVLADIAKNGCRPGYQADALELIGQVRALNTRPQFREGDFEIINTAWNQAKNEPREEKKSRLKPSPVDEASIAYQKAFEKMKIQIATSSADFASLDWQSWSRFTQKQGMNLLDIPSYNGACSTAARQRWEGHKWEWRTSGWDYIRAEEKKVVDKVKEQAVAQYDTFIDFAKSKPDNDPDGRAARQHLLHIVRTNGDVLSKDLREEGVKKAAKAIEEICRSSGNGRGDMINGIQLMLTDSPLLSAEVRQNLLNSYMAMIEPDGRVRRETAAEVLAMTMNCEQRRAPKPGQPGYDESVKLQLDIMDKIMQNANKEMLPVLRGWANFHESKAVRDRAQVFHDLLKRGPKVKVDGNKVSEVEYVNAKKRSFVYEGEILTQVTDTDGRPWRRIRNNGGAGYSDRWSCGDENDIRKDLTVDADGTFHYTRGSERRSERPDLTASKKLQ